MESAGLPEGRAALEPPRREEALTVLEERAIAIGALDARSLREPDYLPGWLVARSAPNALADQRLEALRQLALCVVDDRACATASIAALSALGFSEGQIEEAVRLAGIAGAGLAPSNARGAPLWTAVLGAAAFVGLLLVMVTRG